MVAHARCVSTKPLWFASVLVACTANAASSESSPRPHACAPAMPDDIEPHDVLRIASADGSMDLVVHAWTDRDRAIVDVHTVWQPSMWADDAPMPFVRPDVRVDADPWRISIRDGAVHWEIDVTMGDDDDRVLAFASVVTGDDEPTWCRLHSARLGAGRIESRCEDASGTEVEGWISAAPRG
jgi:hypothetical protein